VKHIERYGHISRSCLVVTLRRLILSNNHLTSIPTVITLLVNLEYFDIANNPLIVQNGHDDYSCLPVEFSRLTNLHTLIMSDCRLKHIPFVVWHCTSLRTLDLSRNRVGFLMNEIGMWPCHACLL
jgi:Leucine-rich repeat (LRR) protein